MYDNEHDDDRLLGDTRLFAGLLVIVMLVLVLVIVTILLVMTGVLSL